jgi:hypothetical protein
MGTKMLTRSAQLKSKFLSFREWLKAVDEGDEDRAENNKSLAVISFECDPIDEEEAAKWTAEVRKLLVETEKAKTKKGQS